MFCYKCGSKIPDNAHFCPFCGEVMEEEEEPTSNEIPVAVPETSVVDSDLKLSLGGFDDYITSSKHVYKEIDLFIENISVNPVYQIELQISGPPEVYIPPVIKKFRVIGGHTTKRATFKIMPRKLGRFTLSATLKYESGDILVLPINLQVESSNLSPQASYGTVQKPAIGGSFVAAAIVLGIIALMLIGFGISTAFNSISVGITMIIIGIIIFAIATQGKCFLCFLACDGCDCDGCDCDC